MFFRVILQQIAQEAQQIFIQPVQRAVQYHSVEQMSIAEEYVFQVPIEGANISVIQPGMAEQIVNYAPIVHTIPAGQTETIVQNVDPTTPLYIVTPAAAPVTIQIPANQSPIPPHVIEIPMQTNQPHEVSEFISIKRNVWLFFIR